MYRPIAYMPSKIIKIGRILTELLKSWRFWGTLSSDVKVRNAFGGALLTAFDSQLHFIKLMYTMFQEKDTSCFCDKFGKCR